MDRGSPRETKNGRAEAVIRRRHVRFILEFTAVFAVAASVISLVAGLSLGGYLTAGVRTDTGIVQRSAFIAVAASLAALYPVLVLLLRWRSGSGEAQQAAVESSTHEMKSRYESIVAVLCAALDLQDNVSQGHARRVSEVASVVAYQMGLRKEQMRQIEKAAILHDIGKIGVADAVLSKPGPLNDSEWEEMRRHPELGHQVLTGIDFLRDAADVVHAHHERWDGQGYPKKLKGEEITLGARILAVVDAYCAMTSHRPYRKAMPHRKALDEILRNAGSQFDPAVVRAFTEAERQGYIDIEQRNGRGRGFRHSVLQPSVETVSATPQDEAVPAHEETVPAAGE